MGQTSQVIVVGAGAAGCAAAYFLARAGVKATIIERAGVGSQASGYAAGWLNPLRGAGIPGPQGPLALESFGLHLETWDQLKDESGVDFKPRIISMVTVAFEEPELAEMEDTLAAFEAADEFSARRLDGAELRRLEPRVSRDAVGGLYTHGDGMLNSYEYTRALLQAAEKMGAQVRSGTVTGLKSSNGRVVKVLTEKDEMACGNVVLAMGPWAREAEAWLNIPLPVEPLKGEILRLELPGQPLGHQVVSAKASLFPKSDGLVWAGTTEERRGFDRLPSQSARDTILTGAAKLMPAMAEARLVQHTACLRPITSDWLPILGKAPGWDNVYLATGAGMKGILMSMGMGKAIAELITEGSTKLSIESLGPERFSPKS